MIVTYDPDVDAAYIQLAAEILTGGVAKTYPCDPREIGGMINLDFDSEREISRCRDNGRQPVATTRNSTQAYRRADLIKVRKGVGVAAQGAPSKG